MNSLNEIDSTNFLSESTVANLPCTFQRVSMRLYAWWTLALPVGVRFLRREGEKTETKRF